MQITQQYTSMERIAESKTFLDHCIQFVGASENAGSIKEYVEAVDSAVGEYQVIIYCNSYRIMQYLLFVQLSLSQGIYRLNAEQKSLLEDLKKYTAHRIVRYLCYFLFLQCLYLMPL
jgi:hypothetical protein